MKKDVWSYVLIWSVGVFLLALTSFFFRDSVVAEILLVSILPWSFVVFMTYVITNEADKSPQERFVEGVKQNIEHYDRTMEQKRKLRRYKDYIYLFTKNIKFSISEEKIQCYQYTSVGRTIIPGGGTLYTIHHDGTCEIDDLTFKLDPYEMLYKNISFQSLYQMAEAFGIKVPWEEPNFQ